MDELDVELGFACIFKFHADIKNGWWCTKSSAEQEIKFPALSEGRGRGVDRECIKEWEDFILRDLKYSAFFLNLIYFWVSLVMDSFVLLKNKQFKLLPLYLVCIYTSNNHYFVQVVFLFCLLGLRVPCWAGHRWQADTMSCLTCRGFWKNRLD